MRRIEWWVVAVYDNGVVDPWEHVESQAEAARWVANNNSDPKNDSGLRVAKLTYDIQPLRKKKARKS